MTGNLGTPHYTILLKESTTRSIRHHDILRHLDLANVFHEISLSIVTFSAVVGVSAAV